MSVFSKRVVAFAATATLVAATFGTIAAGANAQDQAEAETLEMVSEIVSEPQVRFVASPVVQPVPVVEGPVEAAADTSGEAIDAGSLSELVANVETPDTMAREMRCLAQAVYFESRGESLAGQLAVARVVINRSDHATFPDDYCSVVAQRAQFSFVRGGRIPEPNRGSQAWERAKAIAKIAHRDMWSSDAGDALYFHATHVLPRWAGRLEKRATIDSHIFYR